MQRGLSLAPGLSTFGASSLPVLSLRCGYGCLWPFGLMHECPVNLTRATLDLLPHDHPDEFFTVKWRMS